jgi:hypothetical protein
LLRFSVQMQDRITILCRKLLATRHPEEIQPVSQQLRHAIAERVERIREKVVEVVLIDRIVDQDVLNRMPAKEHTDVPRQTG